MTYVDPLQPCPRIDAATPKWKYVEYCHLWADSIEELEAMARTIKLKPAWFRDVPGFPHYGITLRKRGAALAAGAHSVSRHDLYAWLPAEMKI